MFFIEDSEHSAIALDAENSKLRREYYAKKCVNYRAAKRMGAACARLLHSEGCNVFLHYRSSKEAALQLCYELNQIRLIPHT